MEPIICAVLILHLLCLAADASEQLDGSWARVVDSGQLLGGCESMQNGLCTAVAGKVPSLGRSQLFHNMYFILAGVMLWPVSFVVVWVLANRYGIWIIHVQKTAEIFLCSTPNA
jgi:hypothetical protein